MEIDYKKILTGLMSKAYKLDNGKLEELFNAEGATSESIEASLLTEDTQRVSLLKGQNADNKDSFNQGYAKGKKESLEKFEGDIKAAYGLTSETIGIDLIKEVVTANSASGQPGEITEDNVKKHPAYLQMERSLKGQIDTINTEHTTKLNEIQAENKRNETFHGVRQRAIDLLSELNPVEAKNVTVANNNRNTFVNALKSYDFEQQADGTFLVLKDGKREEDQHGHAVRFEDIVKDIAGSYYEFHENNGGANGGNGNKPNQGQNGVPRFKSQEEAEAYSKDNSVPLEQRITALQQYTESQTK